MIPMEKRIVCLGILVSDVVGRPVQSVPALGRLVLVEEMGLYTGSCAVNSASALAMLDLPFEVIGKVGADTFGEFIVNALQKRGVGAQGVKRDSEIGTSATMVMVDSEGERRFIHYIGANARLTLDDIEPKPNEPNDEDRSFGSIDLRRAFNQVRVLDAHEYHKKGVVDLDVKAMRTQPPEIATKHLRNSLQIFLRLVAVVRSMDQAKMNELIVARDYEELDLFIINGLMGTY